MSGNPVKILPIIRAVRIELFTHIYLDKWTKISVDLGIP